MQTNQQQLVPALRFPEFEGEWERVKLGEILSFKNGINAAKEQYGKGYKFINVLDIIANDFITYHRIIGKVEVSEEVFKKYEVSYGDILFQRSSETREEVGQSNVYLDKEQSATFGGFVIRGKKIAPYVPYYLHHVLKTQKIRKEITKRSGGSTRYNVSQGILSAVPVTLSPSLPEQQKIAHFLSLMDKKTALLKEITSLLQALKKGMMQQLFGQQVRFLEENGEAFPDWRNYEFEELAIRSKEKYDPRKEKVVLPCIELESISPETGLLLSTFDSTQQKSIKNKFHKGQVLYGKLRPYLRKYLTAPFDGVCSSEIWVFEAKKVLNNFLYYIIQSERFNTAANISTGTKMPRADWKYISSIPFATPSLPEQKKIAHFLSTLDQQIQLVEAQQQATQEQKKGFLQQLLV